MKKQWTFIFVILLICAALYGCNRDSESESLFKVGFLHETPQVYVLSDENSFMLMPTVTLYENGNARLSQPIISSYGLFDIGTYKICSGELTVSHSEDISAMFKISDNGNTLTLESATIGYAKAGSVYKYRSNADYLQNYKKVDGKSLTVDLLRELAGKVQNLKFMDFDKYAYIEINPDHRIFSIEGQYTLTVLLNDDDQLSCSLINNRSGLSFPLNLHGSTGLILDEFLGIITVPKFVPKKWLDYYGDEEMPWDGSKELTLSEFPSVTFIWTPEKITAGDKVLFYGMPVWNVYLADLTNDGKPELCATISMGSGIVDTHIIVYDYATDKIYLMQDRMKYDYFLSIDDGTKLIGKGKLLVNRIGYSDPLDYSQHITTELQLVNGEISKP